MKCKNKIEGEICGAEIPPSAKWCAFCGRKVKVEDDPSFYLSKTCPVCSAEVTKRHKFCTECGWKVDPSLFQSQKCQGKTEDGKICGADLLPSDKFCAECGTVKIKPLSKIEETELHPVAEVKVDDCMQDENLRQTPESEFYKRSDSTDKQTTSAKSSTSTLESQDGTSSDLLLEVFTESNNAICGASSESNDRTGPDSHNKDSDEYENDVEKDTEIQQKLEDKSEFQTDDVTGELAETEGKISGENQTVLNVNQNNAVDQAVEDHLAAVQKEVVEGINMEMKTTVSYHSESQKLPACEQIVDSRTGLNTEKVDMETVEGTISDNQDLNQETSNTECSTSITTSLGLSSAMSEAGNTVSSPEQSYQTLDSKNKMDEGIPPHFIMNHPNIPLEELCRTFQKSTNLNSAIENPKACQDSASIPTLEDNINNNGISLDDAMATNIAPTTDDEISVVSQADCHDNNSSSDEKDEDTTQGSQSTKSNQIKKLNRKKKEQKKKERKRRRENRGKPDKELYDPSAGKKGKKDTDSKNNNEAKNEGTKKEAGTCTDDKINNNSSSDDNNSSSDEKDEDTIQESQSTKSSQRKKTEQKKKERKRRRENRGKPDKELYDPSAGKKGADSKNNNEAESEGTKKEAGTCTSTDNKINNDEKQKQDVNIPNVENSGANSDATGQSYASVAAPNIQDTKGVTTRRSKDYVDVCFHAIFSPAMFNNLETDKVCIIFDHVTLGSWKKKYQMKVVQSCQDSNTLFTCNVDVPKYILNPTYYRASYNYVVVHESSKETLEQVPYSNGVSGTSIHRVIQVHPEDLKKGYYHRYDGIIRPNVAKNKNFIQSMADKFKKGVFGIDEYKDMLLKDASLSANVFMPHWQISSTTANGINGNEMICHIKYIVDGLREVYHLCAGLWDDIKSFDKLVTSILKPTIQKIIEVVAVRGKDIDEEGQVMRLITAVTLTVLVEKYTIDIELKGRITLCELLLPRPDFEKKICSDVEGFQMFFPEVSKVAESVLSFARNIASTTELSIEKANPCWLFCLPVLHFLQEKCVPFEEPPAKFNHNDRVPVWWGISEFKSGIDNFKGKSVPWQRLPLEMLEKLSPYFKVDYYLPRSFISAVKTEYVQEILTTGLIPSDVVLALLYYYLRTTRIMTKDSRDSFLMKLFKQAAIQTYIDDPNERAQMSLNDAYRCMRISADVLKESLESTVNRNLRTPSMEVFLLSLDLFDKKQDGIDFKSAEVKQLNIIKDEHSSLFYKFSHDFCDELSLQPFYNDEFNYLQAWNAALKVKVPNGSIRDHFLKLVEDTLQSELNKKGQDEKLIEIYCVQNECFESPVQALLSEVALKSVQRCSNFDWTIVKEDAGMMRFVDLLSNVLERNWDTTQRGNPHSILEHALSWAPFPTFVEVYHQFSKSLKSDSLQILHDSIVVLKEKIQQLLNGEIMVKDLKLIGEKKEHFQKILTVMKDVDAPKMMRILAIREKELQAYTNTLQTVQTFLYYCIHCKADTSVMDDKLRRLEHLDTFPLNHIVKTVQHEDLENFNQYKPFITIFELSQEEIDMLPEINECSKGLLFTKLWEERGITLERQKNRKLTIQEVLQEVWVSTEHKWCSICQKLKKGTLLFTEFNDYFGETETGNLRSELNLLGKDDNDKWVDERLDQIQKYRNLQECMFGAKAILEVVDKFELKGNFKQIRDIHRFTMGADTSMNKLDRSLLKICAVLKEVTKERAECLKTFIRCKPLVDWLKESMPSGLKELKVFVDLASISAGEGDMEIAKVNCLHSATTGYAPLIFNLKKECNSEQFLFLCEQVWNELDANPHLPEKLIGTNEQLTWLQSVKKSHGSVEVSSLAQAEAINTNGIYQVGNLTNNGNVRRTTLTDVIELHVADEEKTGQRNRYKYDQLHDLQSRLMLVAGKAEKGKDDVDRFMLILDAVVRLGNIYTKLLEEGCVLFSQWHVKLFCNRQRFACAFIHFGYGEDKQTLKGRIDKENEDVSFIIPKIAKFLEQCHDKWFDFIDDKREKYYSLNFFTIDQMVILQQELVKIGSGQEPSALIYPLLSAVKQGCTKEDLVRAMSVAKSDVERLDMDRQKEMEKKDSEEIEMIVEEVPDEIKTGIFLKEMAAAGFPLTLAEEALKHVNPEDIDGGIVWCMDNEDDVQPMEQDMKSTTLGNLPVTTEDEVSNQTHFAGWTQTCQSLASVTGSLVHKLGIGSGETAVDKLIKALEELWETFLTSISSSVSDYLSVEHLGMILNRLAEQEMVSVERTFLPCFKDGEPNLIICPQSEIYNTVLSVYSHEDDRPLPQSDEVLLCTPHTTLDMLEIFWRRALFADNNKVHCLVNADLLDYDVSDKGEKSLERHMKNAEAKDRTYRLVVICSSENEYKSRIVAALDKYHRPQLTTDVATIRKYLLTKLKVDKSSAGIRSASAVDFERCSVRVVKSLRAGVGKSLYKKRMVAELFKLVPNVPRRKSSNITIPLHEKTINIDSVMDSLLKEILPPRCQEPRLFHIDISHEVQQGVDALLFQLLILGCLGHSSGHVWRRSDLDYYIIESMPLLARDTDTPGFKLKCVHHCLDILPHITCRSPVESLEILSNVRRPPDYTDHDRLFDPIEFKSSTFQRPFHYLKRLEPNYRLAGVTPNNPDKDKSLCLQILLRHCGVRDPSWSELHHFVSFLNKQLQDFEVSTFCGTAAVEDLPGFAEFVLRFLIQMSRDFSTRSLAMSEESPMQMLQRQVTEDKDNEEGDYVIQLYQMRRTWETSPHPYLFFNPDQHSMTFLGFNIDKKTGHLIDQQTKTILEQRIMHPHLYEALVRNNVNLAENFDDLPRHEKILKLCNVMGVDMAHDPDETYELTTDNVKKILAIYMRFRCEIPVIIMGETGCGKTRLIKFMCALQQPPGVIVENMILMKVHGGTKASDIVRKVRKAEEIATKNAADYPNMDTVLFFDEANTTEAIGVIKEIMCDKSLGGKPIKLHERLKIVAACNPYRKHSDELIKRLEQAGLGYHVNADKTTDKLGRVPMRRLVYRVQPLPQSMLPLVWDFGQLDTNVEELYIRQMVIRYIKNNQLPAIKGLETTVSKILTVSQQFMREQKDECSFVSLRDVERVLQVMSWFYRQSEDDELLFKEIKEEFEYSDTESEEESMEAEFPQQEMDDVTRSLVLALGVCYHACLKNREQYREAVARYFTQPLLLPGGADQIEEEILKCQSVFLEHVKLAPNIAKNQALKENVFMMIVCIELRIPMFLVGKPGSSKSLAKTIVADAMQGNAAHNEFFKNYKQVQMVSFQCSPLSVPEGIMGTFRQCAAYQKDKNLDRFVSIVVLDEIGLAEDSPRMPLKTLHPLLEDGCPDDEEPEPYKKVAFIGISNWALDPAKMNRGILVQREVPDITELIESAEGICSTNKKVLKIINPMIQPMAESYLDLFKEASTEMREFFGLRDFYSLLKMLYGFVSTSRTKPTWIQLKHSILRNFGGLENVNPEDIFYSKLSHLVDKHEPPRKDDPDCTSAGMIQACLTSDHKYNSESRYLLLLTENYGALTILQQKIFTMDNAVVIFGSSFPSDQEYTQVCRNINRIKVCMETGSTVILLNLENLYESLYDALNQYYVEFGGERYVDLGLGSHRVKCRVHKKFRLIVVAEKEIVYNKFPIPLINRLEKHFLSLKTMLTLAQLELAYKLQDWAQLFCEVKVARYLMKQRTDTRKIGDAFMGYHDDTCAAIILHVCQENKCDDQAIPHIEKEILRDAQLILLWCATPAAVVQRVSEEIFMTYFQVQHHESLADYLHHKIVDQQHHDIHAQITTNSKLLSSSDVDILCRFIPILRQNVTLLTLQSFDTEQQFSRKIRSCFDQNNLSNMLLIVQCDCGDQNADLIASARYTVQLELQQVERERIHDIHVVFLIQLPCIAGGCFTGFQCGLWHSAHIDDIHPAPQDIPSVADMHGKSVSALLGSTKKQPIDNMEVHIDCGSEDVERIEIDLAAMEMKEANPNKTCIFNRQFKIDYLIKECIQPALGNVKDTGQDSSRPIDRLKILLNCLQNEQGDTTVLTGIAEHLTSILREKEQSLGSLINNWLSVEASKPENINRAGTFRKFAVQCLESKVIPILAGIIAFIDTNRNLDILSRGDNQDWKIGIWLQIFNNPDLTQLKYSLMVSPSRQQELQEVAVKTTSVDGNDFSALMPFSWLIFGQIDEVLRKTIESKDIADSYLHIVMRASEIFQSLPMGELLEGVDRTLTNEILKAYIHDFIYMVHPVQSEDECNLVCESVMTACRQLITGEFGRLIPTLLGCHMAFILHDARFKNFSHIVHSWADCSQKTIEFQQTESNFYLVTDEEFTLDILALHMLVENLEPSKDSLNNSDSRNKWLRQLCDYRPVVERIIGHFNQDIENQAFHYGERCQRGIEKARQQWTRAVVVKLFIEHVCTSGKEDIDIKRCMPLWTILREGADMKDVKSLEKVEKVLKLCNKDVVKQCFGQSVCESCENVIEGAPVRLPCSHVICRKCLFDCLTLKEFECPKCHQPFPKGLNPDESETIGDIGKYLDYRRRCNSFFMEVVSQLCFAEGTPPSEEVVQKLLSYIIGHVGKKKVERVVSKELTIFDDSIDPTPVVRSFLLQHLMQTSGHVVERHMSSYFDRVSSIVETTGDPFHLVELCQLIIQCMEDSLHQQCTNRDDEVTMATKMLRDAAPNVTSDVQVLHKIDHISRVRFSLTVVAKNMHKLLGTSQKLMPDPISRRLFDAAAKLCEECKSPWPRRYFVKQLCRCYGIDRYHTILAKSDASFLRWVRLPELKGNKVKECHDRYIVTGDEYKELRETVVTTVLSENSEKLGQMLQRPTNEWQTRIRLLLALHREITMNNVYGGDPQKFSDKGKAFLYDFLVNLTKNKDLTQRMFNNTLWRIQGNIIPGMDLAHQNIVCLLTHYLVLMSEIPGKKTLLTPLRNIALNPRCMMNAYYPTMPQDELGEVKEALLAARVNNPNENPVFYRCPNGHPYVIGNCGNPTTVGICKTCGREIGGEGHQLSAGNKLDAGGDRTETGHILGRAARLGPITAPERKLNRASFAVLRLLTHLSMYIGANVNTEAICESIKPNIDQRNVYVYLYEHIELDLTSIQNILGKNKDDVLLLMHHLLAEIMNRHTMAVIGEKCPPSVCGLLDKNSRSKWEDDFVKKYVVRVVQDMDNILGQSNEKILVDQRLGSDTLLQILYETDKPQETHDILTLHEVPAVWRYRAMISVNHLRQSLDATKQRLPVLRLFLREEHHLRVIRFVPSIIRLQKMLIQKYSRKLDRAEATTLTIQDVKKQMRQERRLKEFGHLLDDFIEAWNCVRDSLETYVCPANESLVTVSKEYCRSDITEKTPISYLLPTHRDAGLCSYVLLFFLLKKQNLFLQNYCDQCKRKEDSLPKVHVKDISSAHLISYHPDRDLLPMVLANCNYSFEVGQGTKVEYNFTNLERQLMDRFLFSKSIIYGIQEIETITYRSESTNAVVFKSLCDRVKQEKLKPAVQSQICGEVRLKSYPDLCESLDKLDITISFLKSVGSDPESFLHDFMSNTLKMDNPLPSQKAQQASRCKHTMSLWLTMALERAKLLAKYDKKAFEGISDNFKKSLTEEQRQAIEEILNKLPIEQIDVLVELIFECIVLKIDVPQNKDDEDYVDMSKISLCDALFGYFDACPYEEELIIDESLKTAINQLRSDTEEPLRILTGQSVEVWNLVNKIFTEKQQQRH